MVEYSTLLSRLSPFCVPSLAYGCHQGSDCSKPLESITSSCRQLQTEHLDPLGGSSEYYIHYASVTQVTHPGGDCIHRAKLQRTVQYSITALSSLALPLHSFPFSTAITIDQSATNL